MNPTKYFSPKYWAHKYFSTRPAFTFIPSALRLYIVKLENRLSVVEHENRIYNTAAEIAFNQPIESRIRAVFTEARFTTVPFESRMVKVVRELPEKVVSEVRFGYPMQPIPELPLENRMDAVPSEERITTVSEV